jgi:hypothetical protein
MISFMDLGFRPSRTRDTAALAATFHPLSRLALSLGPSPRFHISASDGSIVLVSVILVPRQGQSVGKAPANASESEAPGFPLRCHIGI